MSCQTGIVWYVSVRKRRVVLCRGRERWNGASAPASGDSVACRAGLRPLYFLLLMRVRCRHDEVAGTRAHFPRQRTSEYQFLHCDYVLCRVRSDSVDRIIPTGAA